MADELKFKNNDLDFLLKQKIVDLLDIVINKSVTGDLRGFFEAMKRLRSMISPYKTSMNDTLEELEELLDAHFDNLRVSPTKKDRIILANKSSKTLVDLLDVYFSSIIKAFQELDLWFSTKLQSDDLDVLLSNENFNDDTSLVKQKREWLKTLDTDDLIDFMASAMVHEIYARAFVSKALKGD